MISFRNHKNTKVNFSPGITIIWGENGSGKTSTLEAIHSLSLGKSFRTNNKKELIKEGAKEFLLRGFFKNQGGYKNAVFYSQDILGNKKIKINKKTIVKRKDLLGINNVVVFSPEEEKITKGSPGERRRFFDKVFSICSKKYLEGLLEYNKALRHRNAVFKQKNKKKIHDGLLAWNQGLVSVGQQLWDQRERAIEEFSMVFSVTSRSLDKKIDASIVYKKKSSNKKEFLKKTEENKETDTKRGFTTFGPHKDEILFLWNKRPIRKHGSQGENKIFLALLKITELVFLSKKTRKNPIFLIDDIFATLDVEKSKKLLRFVETIQLEESKKPQTIITTTDLAGLQKSGFFLDFNNIKKHQLLKNETT